MSNSIKTKFFIWVLILLGFSVSTSFAKTPTNESEAPKPRKKVGLALSGGASKGFAHIGVLQVLIENNIPIDYIAGTSMGAIMGGLYSVGYSIDSLETIVRTINWNQMYYEAIGRTSRFVDQRADDEKYVVKLPFVRNEIQLPAAVISGQRFYNELALYTIPANTITDFNKLSIPFRAIATNLSTGSAYVFKSGNLALAIRASMSIPTILKPVEIDNIKLVDGGIARNLPAIDVKNMGADIIIGVDVGEPPRIGKELNDIFAILDQSMSFQINKNVAEQYKFCDVIIRPKVDSFGAIDFDSLNTFIQLGRDAATEALPEILKLINNDKKLPKHKEIHIPKLRDIYFIDQIHISGVRASLVRHVRATLNATEGKPTTIRQIRTDVSRLLGIGLFENINYALTPATTGRGYILAISIQEKKDESFSFGFRYDDFNKAAFIFNLQIRDRFFESSEISNTIRVGNEYLAEIYYRKYRLIPPRLALSLRLKLTRTPIPIYSDLIRVAELGLTNASGSVDLSSIKSQNLLIQLRFKTEYFYSLQNFGVGGNEEQNYINTIALEVKYDNLSSIYYPKSGGIAQITALATNHFVSPYEFIQFKTQLHKATSLGDHSSLQLEVFNGTTISKSIPSHYLFYAGSSYPSQVLGGQEFAFYGFNYRSINAAQFSFARAQLDFEVRENNYLSFIANMGMINETFSTKLDDYTRVYGGGIQYGITTPVGPLQLIFMTGSRDPFIASLNLGYRF